MRLKHMTEIEIEFLYTRQYHMTVYTTLGSLRYI